MNKDVSGTKIGGSLSLSDNTNTEYPELARVKLNEQSLISRFEASVALVLTTDHLLWFVKMGTAERCKLVIYQN